MIFELKIDENSTIDMYENFLSNYKEWKVNYRDIKLSYLLENKSIEFTIEELNIMGTIVDGTEISPYNIKVGAFIVKKLIFTLKGNDIKKLLIDVIFLENDKGRLLKSLLNYGIPIEIMHKFDINNMVNPNDLIFYVDTPNYYSSQKNNTKKYPI